MTQAEFEALHDECAKALHDYMKAATTLCRLLKELAERRWLALSTGGLSVPDRLEAGELAIFEPSNNAIDIHANTDTDFVGSAAAHPKKPEIDCI
jgi:hypothetical protein